MEAAAKKIKRLAPTATDGNLKKFLQEALDELKEGQEAIAERQKHIRIADQSEYHWGMVEVYKVGGLRVRMRMPKGSKMQKEMLHYR